MDTNSRDTAGNFPDNSSFHTNTSGGTAIPTLHRARIEIPTESKEIPKILTGVLKSYRTSMG